MHHQNSYMSSHGRFLRPPGTPITTFYPSINQNNMGNNNAGGGGGNQLNTFQQQLQHELQQAGPQKVQVKNG